MGGLEGPPKPPGARRRPGEAGAPLEIAGDQLLTHDRSSTFLKSGIVPRRAMVLAISRPRAAPRSANWRQRPAYRAGSRRASTCAGLRPALTCGFSARVSRNGRASVTEA